MEGWPQPRTIQVNGADLAYVALGEGDAVVFVHGSLGDYRDWVELLAPFARRYRAITYSRRRHWPNAWPDDDSGCEAPGHAADLAGLIDALGLAPAHLIGHSYGALVSLVLAAEQPDLVRTLVLGEPPLIPWLLETPDGRALYAAFAERTHEPARQAFAQGDLEAGVRRFLDGVVGEGAFDHLPPPGRAVVMDDAPEMVLELETPSEAYFSTLTCEDAARVTAPALLLSGELSPPLFHSISDELARCLPEVNRATIPGVSHDLQNRPVFTETVLDFLAKH